MGLSLTFIDYPFYVASENSNTIFSDPNLFYVRVRCSFKFPVKSKPSLPLMSTLDPSVGLVIPRPIADATIPVPSGNLTRRQPRFQQVHDRIIYQWWMFKHFKPCVFWNVLKKICSIFHIQWWYAAYAWTTITTKNRKNMGPTLAQMLGSEVLSNLDPGFGQTLDLGFNGWFGVVEVEHFGNI